MNFFEHQDRARSVTGKLVALFAIAIFVLVVVTSFLITLVLDRRPPELGLAIFESAVFFKVAAVVVAVVLLGALYRIVQLSRGGRVIAEGLGGRLLERNQASLDEMKILNVVEEMALASGVPVPPVYLIEDDAINAFAAGFQMHDAVIGITRGAIRLLKRDELQGVIAHEFSHIFNGDMRLNLRLIGWLHGLLLIGLIGRVLLRMPRRSGRNRKGEGSAVLVGLALTVLGYVGILFGNLIKSAVSRQREFLADASAVQFTRNPEGIGNALKKVGGYPLGSRMLVHDTTEINHMLFGETVYGVFTPRLFATHPPLKERILRVDPRWDGALINPDRLPDVSYSQLPTEEHVPQFAPKAEASNAAVLAERVIDSVGMPTVAALQEAQAQLAEIPVDVRQHLDDPLSAMLMMWALLVSDSDDATKVKQLELLKAQRSDAEFNFLSVQVEVARQLPHSTHFALVELAQPQLFRFSKIQRDSFLQMLDTLIQVDGKVSVYEWSMKKLLQHNLREGWRSDKKMDLSACLPQCHALLSALAYAGNAEAKAAKAALQESYAALDANAQPASVPTAPDFAALDKAMQQLLQLKPLQKPKLLKAMVMCIQNDGRMTDDETTLLRVVAALLDCPIPPLTQ